MLIVFHWGSVVGAVFDRVHHQPHGGLGRKDIFLLGDVLFQDVVLGGAAQLVGPDALLLGGGDIHGPDDRRRRVDRHAGGDLVQGDAVQQDLHILQRGDRHAAVAELAQRFGRIGVVAHQGRQIEGDRQARLALVEQVFEALVGLFGRAKTGEHAHRPELAPVESRVDAAGVRVVPGQPQIVEVIQVRHIEGRIQASDRLGGGGDKLQLAFRITGQVGLQGGLLPFFQRFAQLVQLFSIVHAGVLLRGRDFGIKIASMW